MRLPRSKVKGSPEESRRYDSRRRRQAAAERRRTIVEAATRRFLSDGYAATTVASVAADAGASVETIYKRFGGKVGLVRAMWESGLEGEGPVPAETRSDAASSGLSDPRAIIRRWTELAMEVSPRVSPILLMIRAAAVVDADMADLLTSVDQSRLARMEHNARAIKRHLRRGVSVTQARDVLFTYTDAALWDALVVRLGWSKEQFADFQRRGMEAQLL